MKATELRIGNYIYSYYPNGEKFVNELNHGGLAEVLVPSSYDFKPDEPIPLTEEWLIRFGFEKGSDGNFYKDSQFTIYKRGVHFGLIEGSLSWVEFDYVHQLQNLYHALTGKELTIKKTIETN